MEQKRTDKLKGLASRCHQNGIAVVGVLEQRDKNSTQSMSIKYEFYGIRKIFKTYDWENILIEDIVDSMKDSLLNDASSIFARYHAKMETYYQGKTEVRTIRFELLNKMLSYTTSVWDFDLLRDMLDYLEKILTD